MKNTCCEKCYSYDIGCTNTACPCHSAFLRKQGAEVHKILNETVGRRLTVEEYSKVVKGIGSMLRSAQEDMKQRALAALPAKKGNAYPAFTQRPEDLNKEWDACVKEARKNISALTTDS